MGDEAAATILVVDDDPSIRALLETRLSKIGYRILTAEDGAAALVAAADHLPDLIILDVMMPRLSGWEVARAVRNDAELADTKIVLLTAIGAGLADMTAPLFEVDAHIDKPFEFSDLEATIKLLLER